MGPTGLEPVINAFLSAAKNDQENGIFRCLVRALS